MTNVLIFKKLSLLAYISTSALLFVGMNLSYFGSVYSLVCSKRSISFVNITLGYSFSLFHWEITKNPETMQKRGIKDESTKSNDINSIVV